MGEGGHEDDGGVGEEGLQDATVPAGGEAKEQAGQEHGGQCCCYHWHSILAVVAKARTESKWRGERKPFAKKREKAGSKDEQEPWNNRRSKTKRLNKVEPWSN